MKKLILILAITMVACTSKTNTVESPSVIGTWESKTTNTTSVTVITYEFGEINYKYSEKIACLNGVDCGASSSNREGVYSKTGKTLEIGLGSSKVTATFEIEGSIMTFKETNGDKRTITFLKK